MTKNKGLGKGLSALIGDSFSFENLISETSSRESQSKQLINEIEISKCKPSKFQPRKDFDTEYLKELENSIKENGVLQPILVRAEKDCFEIIAGERRWRAAKNAGLELIPVIVLDINDKKAFEIALVENLQRRDLNPIEEAYSYQKLIQDFDYTHEDLAKIISKSRSYVTNILRLLKLPESVQDKVAKGDISYSHAKMLIGKNNPEELVDDILKNKSSVRDVERKLKHKKKENIFNEVKSLDEFESELYKIQTLLAKNLETPVRIINSEKGLQIIITTHDLEKFEHVIGHLNR